MTWFVDQSSGAAVEAWRAAAGRRWLYCLLHVLIESRGRRGRALCHPCKDERCVYMCAVRCLIEIEMFRFIV